MDKRLISIGIVILMLSIPFASVSAYEITSEFTLDTGEVISFSNFEGKYILLDSMATWCQPCRVEMLHLQDVYEVVKDEDQVEIISISMDPTTDSLAKVGSFMDEFDAEWSYGLDHNEELKEYLDVIGYPTTFLISPEGEILKEWLGLTEAGVILDEMDKHIEDLPGDFVRENNLDKLYTNLLDSPFFYVFLIMIWTFIIYSGFAFINKLKVNQS